MIFSPGGRQEKIISEGGTVLIVIKIELFDRWKLVKVNVRSYRYSHQYKVPTNDSSSKSENSRSNRSIVISTMRPPVTAVTISLAEPIFLNEK